MNRDKRWLIDAAPVAQDQGVSVSQRSPVALPPGNFTGTGMAGAVSYFLKRHGPAAGHAVAAKLLPKWREYVQPNAPNLGLLGARKYPYPFVGELIRAMANVAHADEDRFIREVVAAGVDETVDTVGRMILRHMVTVRHIAERGQELWNTFHDAGHVTITVVSDEEYVATMRDWPNHDTTVCKMCMEARRRLIERTGGKQVEASRLRCQAWGHDVCEYRVRWRK